VVFNSLAFAIFLPIVLALYYLTRGRLQKAVLLAAGYVFYGAWDPRFLVLVSLSTVLDFCNGLMIGRGRMSRSQAVQAAAHLIGFTFVFLFLRGGALGHRVFVGVLVLVSLASLIYPRLARLPEERRRRIFLRISLVGQLGMLAVFKYFGFFTGSLVALGQRLGLPLHGLHLEIVLPIGISFYTFQTLSYICDVYWRKMEPAENLLDFGLFVCYFPPLVAGPIERASHLLPKILGPRRATFDDWCRGLFLVALGLMKKVTIADGLAGSVASIYGSSGPVSGLDVAVATVAFAIQIYCDFSGYSDIASGVSLFFGIELLKNFDQPYFSINPAEFWRRWHISLSTWLRDYLYVPLGGNRGSPARTYRNLMLTMVLGGLWHGAAWNFVLWGFYQGLLLVVHRLVAGPRPSPFEGGLLQRLPRMAFFFVFVCYGWLLFRAGSFGQIARFTAAVATMRGGLAYHMKAPALGALAGVPLLALLEVWEFTARDPLYYRRAFIPARGLVYAAVILITILGTSLDPQQFIYFQF
jgi:alginate O-acetyltransferase complex protein AlgI